MALLQFEFGKIVNFELASNLASEIFLTKDSENSLYITKAGYKSFKLLLTIDNNNTLISTSYVSLKIPLYPLCIKKSKSDVSFKT